MKTESVEHAVDRLKAFAAAGRLKTISRDNVSARKEEELEAVMKAKWPDDEENELPTLVDNLDKFVEEEAEPEALSTPARTWKDRLLPYRMAVRMKERWIEEELRQEGINVPYNPGMWRLLVMIPRGKDTTEGGIALTESSIQADEILSYFGLVVSVGSLCFQAKTKGGLRLSSDDRKPYPGDWVLFGRHAGERFRTADGQQWCTMSDTEIWGPLKSLESLQQFEKYRY